MPATIPIAFARKSTTPTVRAETPRVTKPKILESREARISGLGQPQYIATTLDVQRVQNALRSAERGDTWLLFTICRDMYASYGHLQSEWAKRKCVITGNPQTFIPYDSSDADDKIACEVIQEIVDDCSTWRKGLNHLLDATLYPVAAAEKIFEAVPMSDASKYKHPLRYRLKELAPIDPTLLCFKLPYIPGFTTKENGEGDFNPDDWEAWLRFYSTNPRGMVNYSMQGVYKPNPNHHIVHRGNMLSSVLPPNFGGHMRAILFPWLLSTQDRDWWGLMMQKYAMPIPVAKVNTQQKDTVEFMRQSLALCAQLGGLIVDSKAEIDWAQVAATDSSQAHKVFQDWCDGNTSKLVIGQKLSANSEKTGGMGSGFAQQAEEVREDIRKSDTMELSDTLRTQLFKQCLEINGYSGRAPHSRWGGMRAGEAAAYSKTQAQMKSAGMRPTERGLRTINENMGVEYEIDPNATTPGVGRTVNAQEGDNDSRVKY